MKLLSANSYKNGVAVITEKLLDTIEMNMSNRCCKSVIRDGDKMFDTTGPLILCTIDWQSYIAHLQSLRIQLIMSIRMILMEGSNRRQLRSRCGACTGKTRCETFRCMDWKYMSNEIPSIQNFRIPDYYWKISNTPCNWHSIVTQKCPDRAHAISLSRILCYNIENRLGGNFIRWWLPDWRYTKLVVQYHQFRFSAEKTSESEWNRANAKRLTWLLGHVRLAADPTVLGQWAFPLRTGEGLHWAPRQPGLCEWNCKPLTILLKSHTDTSSSHMHLFRMGYSWAS